MSLPTGVNPIEVKYKSYQFVNNERFIGTYVEGNGRHVIYFRDEIKKYHED